MCYINRRRYTALWAIVCFMVARGACAQSYHNMPGDTLVAHAVFNDVNVYNITQVHPLADTLCFKWYKQSVHMPASWDASICDNGGCYTSLMDSGMMAPIVPGDDGLMSLHLNPGAEAGTGVIRYSLYALSSADQVDTLTWIITADGPSGLTDPQAARPRVCITDGKLWCRGLDNLYTRALLYSLDGKLLAQQQIAGETGIIPVAAFSARMFVLKLTGKRNFITKVLND